MRADATNVNTLNWPFKFLQSFYSFNFYFSVDL